MLYDDLNTFGFLFEALYICVYIPSISMLLSLHIKNLHCKSFIISSSFCISLFNILIILLYFFVFSSFAFGAGMNSTKAKKRKKNLLMISGPGNGKPTPQEKRICGI